MLSVFLAIVESIDEKEKFTQIYKNYYQKMFNFALTITGNYHSAEDALQNAFLGIAKNIGTLVDKSDEEIAMYVTVAVKNSAINEKGVNDKFSNRILPIDENSLDVIDDDCEDMELLISTVEFIRSLKPIYRDVAFLYFVRGETVKSIARLLGKSSHTVRTQLSRVKELIKIHFKELRK